MGPRVVHVCVAVIACVVMHGGGGGGRNSSARKRKASTRGALGRAEFRRRVENVVASQAAVSHAAKGAALRMRAWSCRRATLCGALRRSRPSLVASAAPRNRGRSGAVKGSAREAPCAASTWASRWSIATVCV